MTTENEFRNGVNGSELELIKEQSASTDAKLHVMRSLLADIKMIAEHGIPYYAFGDNEAACDMNHRLAEIYSLASNDV